MTPQKMEISILKFIIQNVFLIQYYRLIAVND